MARLEGVRLIAHHRFERRNRRTKIILPVVRKSNIQANAGNLRGQSFSFAKHRQGFVPLFPPHIDHAQIRVGSSDLRI